MVSLDDLLFGVALPALVAMILLLVSRHVTDNNAGLRPRYALGGSLVFVVGIGFLVGYLGISQAQWFPMKEPAHWLFWGAVALLSVAALHQFLWPSVWLWGGAVLVIFAGLVAGVFSLLPESVWDASDRILWGAAAWLASTLTSIAVGIRLRCATASAADDFVCALGLCIAGALGAAVVGMSGSKVYGQVAALMPATLAPATLVSPLLRTKIVAAEFAPLFVLLFGGALLLAYLFAELTSTNAVLLFLSPLGLLADRLPPIRRRGVYVRSTIQLLAVTSPAGIALGSAMSKFLRGMAAEFSSY